MNEEMNKDQNIQDILYICKTYFLTQELTKVHSQTRKRKWNMQKEIIYILLRIENQYYIYKIDQ